MCYGKMPRHLMWGREGMPVGVSTSKTQELPCTAHSEDLQAPLHTATKFQSPRAATELWFCLCWAEQHVYTGSAIANTSLYADKKIVMNYPVHFGSVQSYQESQYANGSCLSYDRCCVTQHLNYTEFAMPSGFFFHYIRGSLCYIWPENWCRNKAGPRMQLAVVKSSAHSRETSGFQT